MMKLRVDWKRAGAGCLALGLLMLELRAEADAPSGAPDPQMPGIFDTELPDTEAPQHLRLILRPHFGDLVRHDHLRIPVGVRYGLGENLEVSGELEMFVAHGLGAAPIGSRFGFSGVHLAAKERLPRLKLTGPLDTVVGMSFALPVGTPPDELTDGRRHIAPFVTFSQTIPGFPRLSGFTSFGADFASATRFNAVRHKNAFLEDSAIFTTGAVWRGNDITGTLELTYAASAFGSDENRHMLSVRPGVTWRLPDTGWFHPDGKWVVGVGTRVGFGPDGTDVGLSVKFRGEFDFRRWVRHWRD